MTSVAPTLVVMAAGIGSRFGGTKQLAEVGPGGEALLDYTIADARRAGFGPVVLVVREAIRDAVGDHLARFHADAASFTLLCQDLDTSAADAGAPPRDRPWGTGHAVLSARGEVRGPFAVVNADDYYGAAALDELGRALAAPGGRSPTTYHLVAYRLANTLSTEGTVSRGVCRVAADGRLETVTEHLAIARR
ncbi:MAG: NTP transferase domain-containing protein, partial [Acidimicrobiia bacterium]|nr:NTP transferase domain-containing protein [Acidimicrobiia bacterium]